MEWISNIKNIDFSGNKYSQTGEEVIAKYIFDNIGTTDKYFVDLGAGGYGNGNFMSNTRKFMEDGWSGLMIDKAARGVPDIKEYTLTPENIVSILEKENVPFEFDFLSVDIDSFDFFILEQTLLNYRPRVVCTEFNASLPPNSSLVLKYEEGYFFDNTNKYGYSFGAGKKLFEELGYTLIYNHLNLDLFAVRKDIVNQDCGVTAKQVVNFPINQSAVWENY